MDTENSIIDFIEKEGSGKFIYKGNDPRMKGKTGSFEILYDGNCCGATCNVMFCFTGDTERKIMSAQQCREWIRHCERIDEK